MSRITKSNQFRPVLLEVIREYKNAQFKLKLREAHDQVQNFQHGVCLNSECRTQFPLNRLQWTRTKGSYYCKRCKVDWEQVYKKAQKFLQRNGE